MNNGTYGTKRPALITSDDVDIFYYYRPTRNSESANFTAFKKLNSSNLETVNFTDDDTSTTSQLPGMYNLKLPASIFNTVGFYTIYIKPKEIFTTLYGIGTLAAYPSVRGIVLNGANIETTNASIFNNGGLTGYRIDYYDSDGTINDMYRIVTSSNRCEPIAVDLSSDPKYRFTDSSNLLFCTVTPSSAMSFKSSSLPDIGYTGQKVALVNTNFNPVTIEVEMTNHDIETVSTMLEGNQIRNLDYGLITTFNDEGGIYHQSVYGNVVDAENGLNHDFKHNKTGVIDTSESDKMTLIENTLNG